MRQVISFNNKNAALPLPPETRNYIRMTASNKGGIITDYYPNSNTSIIELYTYDYSLAERNNNWKAYGGMRQCPRDWSSGPGMLLAGDIDYKYYCQYGTGSSGNHTGLVNLNYTADNQVTFIFNNKTGAFQLTGSVSYSNTFNTVTWSTPGSIPFGICCAWAPYSYTSGSLYSYQNTYKTVDYGFTGKIKYLKIWEGDGQGNDVLVRHYVPVLHNNQPCVKDLVNNTYCYSSEPSYTEVGN